MATIFRRTLFSQCIRQVTATQSLGRPSAAICHHSKIAGILFFFARGFVVKIAEKDPILRAVFVASALFRLIVAVEGEDLR